MNRKHTLQFFFNIHLILSFHPHLVLPSTFFPSGFPTKNYIPFLPHMRYAQAISSFLSKEDVPT